jgi:hypothetical protein
MEYFNSTSDVPDAQNAEMSNQSRTLAFNRKSPSNSKFEPENSSFAFEFPSVSIIYKI